jgi:hypothetical protein
VAKVLIEGILTASWAQANFRVDPIRFRDASDGEKQNRDRKKAKNIAQAFHLIPRDANVLFDKRAS